MISCRSNKVSLRLWLLLMMTPSVAAPGSTALVSGKSDLDSVNHVSLW